MELYQGPGDPFGPDGSSWIISGDLWYQRALHGPFMAQNDQISEVSRQWTNWNLQPGDITNIKSNSGLLLAHFFEKSKYDNPIIHECLYF